MNEAKKIKVALLISGLLLCLAVIPVWPLGYYFLLRWVVCGACAYAAYVFNRGARAAAGEESYSTLAKFVAPLIFLAALFNPILIPPLDGSLWILIYLGTALCLLTMAKKIQ